MSAMISSVSRSKSGWTRATWSFETMTLPRAERRSSILCDGVRISLEPVWRETNVPVSSPRPVDYSVDVGVLDLLCLLEPEGLFDFYPALPSVPAREIRMSRLLTLQSIDQ